MLVFKLTKQTPNNRVFRSLILMVVLVLVMSILVGYYSINQTNYAEAATETDLRNQTSVLEQQIAANETVLNGLSNEIDTLDNKLASLSTEIAIAEQKINLTAQRISQLTKELTKTQVELERQLKVLDETLVTLYIRGSTSSFELIVGSDNFSDYFQEQQYLETLKISVQESVDKVKSIKVELKAERERETELNRQQTSNRDVLKNKKAEQVSILNETKGQEASYQNLVSSLQQQLADAEKQLEDLLAAKNFVSLGAVKAGDIIGHVGSTGYSTGPHLHFAVYSEVNGFIDPVASSGSLINGFTWPLPTVGWGSISQYYGCIAPYYFYYTKCSNGNSLHSGLDIAAWYGEPIVAAGDGDIVFRGPRDGYGNAVIIDHGNGIKTYYAHMNE